MGSSNDDPKGSRMLLEARQRRIALAILSFFYSIKGYVWSNYNTIKPHYEFTIAGFLSMNLIWVMGVNHFKIPRLDSWFVLCLALAAMSLVDYSITQSLSQNLYKFETKIQTLPGNSSIVSTEVGDWENILGSNHIFGSMDVNILPPIYVSFSNKTIQCLDSPKKYVVLNLKANTPPPLTVDISYYGFDGKLEKSKFTLEGVNAKSREYDEALKQNIYSYSFRAEKAGVYRINFAEYGNGASYSINKSGNTVLVPKCPKGLIKPHNEHNNHPNAYGADSAGADSASKESAAYVAKKCIGSKFSFDLELSGVPPFEVECLKRIGNDTQILPISFGEIKGPLISLNKLYEIQDEKTFDDYLSSLVKNLRTLTSSLSIDIPIELPSTYYFQILKVVDSTNSTVLYDTDTHKHYWDNKLSQYPNAVKAGRNGDAVIIHSETPPTVSFLRSTELRLFADAYDTLIIPIQLTGTPPWNVSYSITSSEPNVESSIDIFDLNDIRDNIFNITAKVPGIYALKNVADANCIGNVGPSSTVSVFVSVKPQLNINARNIIQKCYGTRGIVFELNFTGEPPFVVEYDELHVETQHSFKKSLSFKKHQETLTLEPELAGTYEYRFTKLSDNAFNKGVYLRDLLFSQVINVPDSASLVPNHLTVCPGSIVNLPLNIRGKNEYQIAYSVSKGSFLYKSTLTSNNTSPAEIVLDSLKERGIYTVNLLSIVDSNGCQGIILGGSATVEVTSSLPRAWFKNANDEYIVVGTSKKFYIQTKGGGNFTVEILHEENNNTISADGNDNIAFTVTEPGTYSIKSVKNSYCNGMPETPSSLKVIGISRPDISLRKDADIDLVPDTPNKYLVHGLCPGMNKKIAFTLKGHPPFFLRYFYSFTPFKSDWKNINIDKLDSSAGNPDSSAGNLDRLLTERSGDLIPSVESEKTDYISPLLEVQSQHERVYIKLENTRPGSYSYYIYPPGDGNYPNISKNASLSSTKPAITISHQVYPSPKAVFLEKVKKVYQCIFNEKKTSLLIGFYGEPPFTFVIGIQRDSGPIVREELVSHTHVYEYQPPQPDTVGMYKYFLHFVRDKNGCQNVINEDTPGNVAYRQIIGIASITPATSSRETCRGDVIPFALEGTPPFTIYYSMNEENMPPIVIREPLLTICPIKSGILKIDKVCNSLGCCSELKPDELSIKVHDLPSISIGEGSNEYIEMREGESADITYKFTGVPPFSFRYNVYPLNDETWHIMKRDSDDESLIKSVLMTDITQNILKLIASTRGKYKVVMVKDAHCQYPPISKPSLCRQSNNLSNS